MTCEYMIAHDVWVQDSTWIHESHVKYALRTHDHVTAYYWYDYIVHIMPLPLSSWLEMSVKNIVIFNFERCTQIVMPNVHQFTKISAEIKAQVANTKAYATRSLKRHEWTNEYLQRVVLTRKMHSLN